MKRLPVGSLLIAGLSLLLVLTWASTCWRDPAALVPVPDSHVTDSLAAVTDSLARAYTADSIRWEAERAEARARAEEATARATAATRRATITADSLVALLDSTEAVMFARYEEERDSIDAAMEQVVEAVQSRALTAEAERDALLAERTSWYAERTALLEENAALRAAHAAEQALRVRAERRSGLTQTVLVIGAVAVAIDKVAS